MRRIEALTAWLPYLRGKRKNAEIILEFMKMKKAFKRRHIGIGGRSSMKGSLPLGQKEINFRDKLRRSIQALNAKSKYLRQSIMAEGGDAL